MPKQYPTRQLFNDEPDRVTIYDIGLRSVKPGQTIFTVPLDLTWSGITELPEGFMIEGTGITELPDDIVVRGKIYRDF